MTTSRLSRRLNTWDATVLGLGSMVGAGIFAAAGPAARAAGSGVLVAVIFAAVIALFNAFSMAQLAAVYPESGGAYAYGRRQLGPTWGFLAGFAFITGKVASCVAMALTFGFYVWPERAHLLAAAVVLVLTFINYLGIKKTAWVTYVFVTIVLLALVVIVFSILQSEDLQVSRLFGWTERAGWKGIFEATGLMFFAFAGYARIATLGEEVKDPERTIPRAIFSALSITIVLYLFVVTATLLVLPLAQLMSSEAPLALAIRFTPYESLAPVVRWGAAVASLSVLLSLLAGISRTVFAMAAQADLPTGLSAVHERYRTPYRAEVLVGILVATCASFADLRLAIGFSSFTILIYYAIAGAAAYQLRDNQRRYPRPLSALACVFCLVIAFNLPLPSVMAGLVLLVSASAIYWMKYDEDSV